MRKLRTRTMPLMEQRRPDVETYERLPGWLERYLSAADRVSALAVGDPRTVIDAKTYTVAGDRSQALHLGRGVLRVAARAD